jgi:16S rRNA processing protein RimM
MYNINTTLKIPNDLFIIGQIGAAYGILGMLKLFSFTENKSDIFKYYPWFIKNNHQWMMLDLEHKKNNKHFFFIKIKNINNRNEAKKLTNCHIMIEKKRLPLLKKNEYYWNDLLNCTILSVTGFSLGKVNKLIRTKSNDILVIKNYKKNMRKTEILIPFLEKTVIKNVDIINKTIMVDWNPVFE